MTVKLCTQVTPEDYQEKRVPANIETAAILCLVDATWEATQLVTPVNTALTTAVKDNIAARAVKLRGTLEFINSEAVPHTMKWGDADLPDNDDETKQFTMVAAIGSEFLDVEIICDAAGLFQAEIDDVDKANFKFHLSSYQYVQNLVE